MQLFPIRSTPGQDLRQALELAVSNRACRAEFLIFGIGSLSNAQLRFANASEPHHLAESTETLSLLGTIALNG